MEEGSTADQPAAMASEERISEMPTELTLLKQLGRDAAQLNGKGPLRDPRAHVGDLEMKRRVALEPDLQRALSVAGAEKGRFSRGVIDGPRCNPSDPTATGKSAACESKRRRMEAGVSAIRELTADAAVTEALPHGPVGPTHGKPVAPPPAMNGHCHPMPSLSPSPSMSAFFTPSRPLETPSPIPSEMSISPTVPVTSGKGPTRDGKVQPGDGVKVGVGDFVRVRASQRDIDVLMKSEEKLWADIGRQACHGWLSRRRAAVKRTGPLLGRVTAIEYEEDGRPMVCMSRLYREEETVCGQARRTQGSDGEKLALVVRVLQKGAAALAVACVRVPAAYVEQVQVHLPSPDTLMDLDDDTSLKSADEDMPSLAPLPSLSSVYIPELDVSVPLCPLTVRWEAPFDALSVLRPHPTGGGRVALWSGGAVCHGCRTLREQVEMWSCRGCGQWWCPSCTEARSPWPPSLEAATDQAVVVKGEEGEGRAVVAQVEGKGRVRELLGPCCKGTCTCLRCAYATNRQAFLGGQDCSPPEAGSGERDTQVARCSKCFMKGPCSSMFRCACCATQWAHIDCVAYDQGQVDRNDKDAAGLTSALGLLGKRVRKKANHGGAMVRVDSYCPRKSTFLLCNEDTGVMTWAPLRPSDKAALKAESETENARPWTCGGCTDSLARTVVKGKKEEAGKGGEGGGKLWSEKVIWGLAEREEAEDGRRWHKLVVMMDDSALPAPTPPASSSSPSLSANSPPSTTSAQAAVPPPPTSPAPSSSPLPSKLPTPPASAAGHTMDELPPTPSTALHPSPLSLPSQSPPGPKPSSPSTCRGWKRRRLEDKGVGSRMVGLLLDQLLGASQSQHKGGKSGPLTGPAVFALPPSLLREVPTRGLRWHADAHQDYEEDEDDSDLPPLTPSLVTFFRGPRLLTDGIPYAKLGEYESGALTLGEHEIGIDTAGPKPRHPTPTPSQRSTQISRPPSTQTVESQRPGSALSSVVSALTNRIMSPPLLGPHAEEAAETKPAALKKAPPPVEVEDKEECARTRAFKPKVRTRGHGGRLSKAATAQAAPDSATEGRPAGAKGGAGKRGQAQAPASKDTIGKERAQRLGQRHMRKQFEGIPSELLKVDDFKARQKAVRFGKSKIHRWGVFAAEALRKDDMLLEYRGEAIGNAVAEIREKLYDRLSIGSDYMFRVDENTVIDATRRGSLARYVNHSCDPNCYTAIIPSDGKKKILLYAKRPIEVGEELCYDYKFPIDPDNKVACHCGAKKCRKFMN